MSQRKKTAYRDASLSSRSASGQPGRERYRSSSYSRQEDSRRRVTVGIVVVGVLVAVSVIAFSLSGTVGVAPAAPSGGASAQPTVDTKALEASVADFKKRVERDPSDVGALISLGNAYFDADQYPDAITWYEQALKLVPKNTDVRTDLGIAYLYSGNPDKAKENWDQVLQQDPNKVQAHYNMAIYYLHANPPDKDKAASEWETVIKLAPNSPDAQSAQKQLQAMGKR